MDPRSPPHDPGATIRLEDGGKGALKLVLDVLKVEVVAGPDAGATHSLALPVVRLGSDRDNDLVLADPAASRHHAELRCEDGALILRDLGSTNGTFLGEARVREVELAPGSEFRIGESRLVVQRGTQTRRALPPVDGRLGELVGQGPAMTRLFGLLEAVAPTPVNVLVTGESGCGKELLARTLHQLSGRAGPLVVFDAATADPEMVRADLFGHVKGAFTGAAGERQGAFRAAHGGTLMIDELGELPLDLQPRLLRALESRQVQPVGGDHAVPVDVRVVAATHRDLPAMVQAGSFRADLYHRLNVIPLALPPLRARMEDLDLLVEHLSASLPVALALSAAARAALAAYGWPGNVRELRNVLERAAVLCQGRSAEPADLMLEAGGPAPRVPAPQGGGGPVEPAAAGPAGAPESLEAIERKAVLAALERHGGNKTAAARELGVSVNTLRRKLSGYGIE